MWRSGVRLSYGPPKLVGRFLGLVWGNTFTEPRDVVISHGSLLRNLAAGRRTLTNNLCIGFRSDTEQINEGEI
jgi:hypothetical protein